MPKHVHFIGIAGKAMAPIAKMFLDLGWHVTGSDQDKVYPPLSTYLEENHLSFAKGYKAENIVGHPDLIVVGRSSILIDKNNPEVVFAKKIGSQVLSYPEVLSQYLVKKNSIVCAGTYGKTTSSALLAWILETAGLKPSFMVGGVPLNFPDGVRNTESEYSIIEGDETPALEDNSPAKFMFYKPKYVLLTATTWDHPEIYKTEKEYLETFQEFIKYIPEEGLLVISMDNKNNQQVSRVAKCPVIWYSLNNKRADFFVKNIIYKEKTTEFEILSGRKITKLKTNLLGEHNLQNICGCVALTTKLGLDKNKIIKAVESFSGIKTRLELLGQFKEIIFYLDFAQHPQKAKETLRALRTRFTQNKIYCIFDPHASILQTKESLSWYNGAFSAADSIIVSKMSFSQKIKKEDFVTGSMITRAISESQPNVFYEPMDEKIVSYLARSLKPNDVVIFLSSGGLRFSKLIDQVLGNFK